MGSHHGHRAICNNENSLKCVFSYVYRKRNRQESTGQKEKNQGISQSFYGEINNLILHTLKSRACFIADYANNHSPKQEIIIRGGQANRVEEVKK